MIDKRVIFPLPFLFLFALVIFAVGGGQLLVVESNSMAPAVKVGSLIVTVPTPPGELQVGDVITYTAGGYSVTHRIVSISEEGFITKGDSNRAPDPRPVFPNQVKGVVCAKIPMIGYPSLLVRELIF